jgi:2'-hydroxyisoflavone reductase
VQVVDSRDLGRLVVALVAGDVPGTFNAVGAGRADHAGGLVRPARRGGQRGRGRPGDPSAVPPGFPLVLPDESWDVMFRRSAEAARAHGLTGTPLQQTARDVLAWDTERGRPPLSVGLSPEQEAALLG